MTPLNYGYAGELPPQTPPEIKPNHTPEITPGTTPEVQPKETPEIKPNPHPEIVPPDPPSELPKQGNVCEMTENKKRRVCPFNRTVAPFS